MKPGSSDLVIFTQTRFGGFFYARRQGLPKSLGDSNDLEIPTGQPRRRR